VKRALRAAVAALFIGSLMAGASVAPVAGADEQLPDLKMGDVYNVQMQRGEDPSRVKLRFGTIVWNVGDGPLEVRAEDREGGVMNTVYQVIRTAGGSEIYAPPGAAAFYAGDGHNHWHIQTFIVIRLFPKAPVSTAGHEDSPTYNERGLRKIGFCLTDLVRAPAELRPANSATHIAYPVSGCGTIKSDSFRMGISPGYGDDYKPFFNLQLIDVTGLPAGEYRLCATVNSTGLWREKADNRENNSSWVDMDLDSAGHKVHVTSSGDTDCEAPEAVVYGIGG
jgi:hypothetical protein